MNAINLKLIHTFSHVAELRSFSRAAEVLGRTPAAISMQINDLEGQIGLKLLERTTRSVDLTPDGSILLGKVRDSLVMLEEGIAEAQYSAARRKSRVVFGCSPTVAAGRLGGILSVFREQNPKTAVSVREMVSAGLLQAIRDREVDFGITPRVEFASHLKFVHLLREPVCALMSANHFDCPSAPLTLDALRLLPLLIMIGMPVTTIHNGKETNTEILELLDGTDTKLNIVCHVRQAHTLVSLAVSGLGISLLPSVAVPDSLPAHMRVVPLAEPAVVRDVGLCTLKGEVLTQSACAMVDVIRADLRRDSQKSGQLN